MRKKLNCFITDVFLFGKLVFLVIIRNAFFRWEIDYYFKQVYEIFSLEDWFFQVGVKSFFCLKKCFLKLRIYWVEVSLCGIGDCARKIYFPLQRADIRMHCTVSSIKRCKKIICFNWARGSVIEHVLTFTEIHDIMFTAFPC